MLGELVVLNWKNIAEASIELSRKVNCFVGNNGMGKTNVLDAVYLLAFCKSAFNVSDAHNVRHSEDFYMVQGTMIAEDGERQTVSVSYKTHGGKKVRLGDVEYGRLSHHIGTLPAVLVSPDDVQLVCGASDERRRMLDMAISQYNKDYLSALIKYNKALTERNALLKRDGYDDTLMSILEEMMSEAAQIVYAGRRELTDGLVPLFGELYAVISGGCEAASLAYSSHLERGALLEQLQMGRAKEGILGYTLHGIHRDDIEMRLDDYTLRREGSQGQTKTYIIALKLALALYLTERTQCKPVLLLDDLFDRLDAARMERIVKLVSEERFGQIFITDTHQECLHALLSEASDYRLYSVTDGAVTLITHQEQAG